MKISSKQTETHEAYLSELSGKAGVSFLFRFSGLFLSFVVTFLLARFYGAAVYGKFQIALSAAMIASVFCEWGMSRVLVRFLPEMLSTGKNEDVLSLLKMTFLFALKTSLLGTGVFLLCHGLLAEHVFQKPFLKEVFFWAGLLIVPATMTNLCGGVFRAKRTLWPILVHREVTMKVLFLLGCIGIYLVGMRYPATLIFCRLLASLAVVVLLVYSFRHVNIGLMEVVRAKYNPVVAKRMMGYASTMVLASFMFSMLRRVDVLMLGVFERPLYVGHYSVAARIAEMMLIVLSAVMIVFPSMAADLYARGGKQELKVLYSFITRWLGAVTLPVFVVMTVYPEALLGVFGEEYTVAATCLRLLAIGQLARAVCGGAQPLLSMTGFHTWIMKDNIVMLIMNVLLNAWLIPRYAINGAALATCIALVSISVWRVFQAYRATGIQPVTKNMLYLIAVVPVFYAVAFAGKQLSDHVLMAVGVMLVLLVIGLAFNALGRSPEDRIVWERIKGRIQKRIGS